MITRWKNLTQPSNRAVSLAVAKTHCRVVDTASVATQANRSFGSGDSELLILSRLAGTIGNQYSVRILASGLNTALSVSYDSNILTINLATDGTGDEISTVNDVIAALYQKPEAAQLFDATSGSGDGTGVLAPASLILLQGGVDSGDEDAYIGLLIDAAVDVVEAITSRALITRDVRMFLDTWPEDGEIELPLSPVSEISCINYLDDSTGFDTDGTDLFDQDIEDQDLPSRVCLLPDEVFPVLLDRKNAVSIDFVAGYGDTDASVPPRIKQCILFLVAHWYSCREPVVNGTAVLSNKVPYTFQTTLNSFRLVRI